MAKEARRMRVIAGEQDWVCPKHDVRVRYTCRRGIDKKTGKSKFMGEYYSCSKYHECGYYVSLGRGTVPVVDEHGIAIGRSK